MQIFLDGFFDTSNMTGMGKKQKGKISWVFLLLTSMPVHAGVKIHTMCAPSGPPLR